MNSGISRASWWVGRLFRGSDHLGQERGNGEGLREKAALRAAHGAFACRDDIRVIACQST